MISHGSDASAAKSPLSESAQFIIDQITRASHPAELRLSKFGPEIGKLAGKGLISAEEIGVLMDTLSVKKNQFFTPTPVNPPVQDTPDQTPPEAASTEVESGDTPWSPSDILAEMERDESHGHTHWTDTYDQ